MYKGSWQASGSADFEHVADGLKGQGRHSCNCLPAVPAESAGWVLPARCLPGQTTGSLAAQSTPEQASGRCTWPTKTALALTWQQSMLGRTCISSCPVQGCWPSRGMPQPCSSMPEQAYALCQGLSQEVSCLARAVYGLDLMAFCSETH